MGPAIPVTFAGFLLGNVLIKGTLILGFWDGRGHTVLLRQSLWGAREIISVWV